MKRGTVALALIVVGLILLVLAALSSTLFVILPDQTVGATLGLIGLIGGVVLVIVGFLVRLTAPKPRPDNEYDHDLPQN